MHRYTKPMVSVFLTFGMLALFVLSINAQTLGSPETNPILLDADTHHLGDQTIEFFDIPTPEGMAYSINFNLPASNLQDSYLRLETYNVEGVNLIEINGQEVGFVPGTWWIGWQPVVLPVPGSVLMEGENTLTIVSENFPTWRLFEHWYDDFMFRQIELLTWQTPFDDDFEDSELNSGWRFVDLLGDCSYNLSEKPGSLSVNIPGNTTWKDGHDLFWLFNFNAPRLLQPVKGDFLIETNVSIDTNCNYQAAGLLAWQDTSNHVRLEKNAWWGGSVLGGVRSTEGSPWTYKPIGKNDVTLRMSRVGDTFFGWYRPEDSSDWSVLGQASAPLGSTLLVGLATYNQNCSKDVSAGFDYFHISQAVPPIWDQHCGTTNQSQPILHGLATAGSQVDLFADGVAIATTTTDFDGTFNISPTMPLSSGSHILTATVTQGGETSFASPKLNLDIDPTETIDFLGVTVLHAPLFGNGLLITDWLRNGSGCAACDGTGFNMWIPGQKPITVTVPVNALDVTSVEVHIGDHIFPLTDPEGDNVFKGTLTPPSVRGLASLEFVVHRAGGLIIEYVCGEIIIDPYGTIYDAAKGISAPIAGATVTLYKQNPDNPVWSTWVPEDNQQNPQVTGSDGRYAFYVPEGNYYISVSAPGYLPYTSQYIQVDAETGPVELPIPLDSSLMNNAYIPMVNR